MRVAVNGILQSGKGKRRDSSSSVSESMYQVSSASTLRDTEDIREVTSWQTQCFIFNVNVIPCFINCLVKIMESFARLKHRMKLFLHYNNVSLRVDVRLYLICFKCFLVYVKTPKEALG